MLQHQMGVEGGTSCSTIDNDVAVWSNHVLTWMCVEDTFCSSHLSIRNMSMRIKVQCPGVVFF